MKAYIDTFKHYRLTLDLTEQEHNNFISLLERVRTDGNTPETERSIASSIVLNYHRSLKAEDTVSE